MQDLECHLQFSPLWGTFSFVFYFFNFLCSFLPLSETCITNCFIHMCVSFTIYNPKKRECERDKKRTSFRAWARWEIEEKRASNWLHLFKEDKRKKQKNKTSKSLRISNYPHVQCAFALEQWMHEQWWRERHAIDTYRKMLVLFFVLPENGKTNINCCLLSIVKDQNAANAWNSSARRTFEMRIFLVDFLVSSMVKWGQPCGKITTCTSLNYCMCLCISLFSLNLACLKFTCAKRA